MSSNTASSGKNAPSKDHTNDNDGLSLRSCSESSSSWDDDDNDDAAELHANAFALDDEGVETPSFHNTSAATSSAAVDETVLPADQERQILLLMLLGQVCALHDPTPRTFTAHVLELFERGILDRQSIRFLYELGLVPSMSPITTKLLLPAPGDAADNDGTRLDLPTTPGNELAFVPGRNAQRSAEASAIRTTLEHQERQRIVRQASVHSEPIPSSTVPVSFAAEHHPLSLSRYQREFEQVQQLSAGAFGTVFQATSKMDGRDYAIKRVPFNATGYSRDSVHQVVREVQCLAVCDHPHVVRYFTSWLEPSWMTGSGSIPQDPAQHQKLLQDIQHLVSGGGEGENSSDELDSFFKNTGLPSRRRRFSIGESAEASDVSFIDDDYSEWTVEADHSTTRDDSFVGYRRRSSRQGATGMDTSWLDAESPEHRRSPDRKYRYQICLFIQMQLCKSTTLADWIRDRNQRDDCKGCVEKRIESTSEIFSQIVRGLCHVHKKGIIHRDLKPANVFVSNDSDGLHFMIGDFGLSKLIESAALSDSIGGGNGGIRRRVVFPHISQQNDNILSAESGTWEDPLTAGVGTASYAAPEQVTSRTYGNEADIFSLGLMLLELLCTFSTEHERMQTFHDCRHKRKLPDDLDEYPVVIRTILACTDPIAKNRPTASELAQVDLVAKNSCEEKKVEAEDLQALVDAKDEQLRRYKKQVEEKDVLIDDLRLEVQRLKALAQAKPFSFPSGVSDHGSTRSVPASSSSSSEDEL